MLFVKSCNVATFVIAGLESIKFIVFNILRSLYNLKTPQINKFARECNKKENLKKYLVVDTIRWYLFICKYIADKKSKGKWKNLKQFHFKSSRLLWIGRQAGGHWPSRESHWFIYLTRLPHQDGGGFPCVGKHNGGKGMRRWGLLGGIGGESSRWFSAESQIRCPAPGAPSKTFLLFQIRMHKRRLCGKVFLYVNCISLFRSVPKSHSNNRLLKFEKKMWSPISVDGNLHLSKPAVSI